MDYTENSTEGRFLIADLASHDRPRERLQALGPEALRTAELIAILLRTGRTGRSALDVAQDVMTQFDNDLGRLAAASVAELAAVKGIGPAKATELRAAFHLATRLAAHVTPERPHLGSPEQAADYLRAVFRGKQQEELHALLMDNKNRLVKDVLVTIGLLDRSQAHPREVFRAAIQHAAAKLILAHNHPSGDPSPSQPDIQITETLVAAGRLVGIEVVDHIVVGQRADGRAKDTYSFREHDLIRPGA
jgi:DNA repair protein RadC